MAAQTVLISEENGYTLRQAQMPDGKMVELKVPTLAAPSYEIAQAGLTSWDYDRSIVGATAAMMGANPSQRLYSLWEVEDFMKKPEGMVDPLRIEHDSIGYVNYELLASWVNDVIGDADLAVAIREVTSQESIYGKALPFIKDLLQERLAAYKKVKDEADADASVDDDNENAGPATQDEASRIDGD